MPPSYAEAVSSHQPSAPLMSDGTPSHQRPVNEPGWNPNMNQAPIYSQLTQPTIQTQVHQTAAPPQQIVIINHQIQLNENPLCMMCPHCQQQTVTKVEFVTSWMTHLMAGMLCLMCWCPCAVLPYCTDCLKDVVHTCSKCNGYIGTYQRSNANRRRW